MSIVPSSGISIKRKSTSRLPIKNSESFSTTFSAEENKFYTAYLLLVKDFKMKLEILVIFR